LFEGGYAKRAGPHARQMPAMSEEYQEMKVKK
jgi:hypothetical protein